ncbi:MAG: tetratricopeptide repeat protein [Flavobacteriales bacterium]|nr:tetratricopeptide repeat protein [Flavobacteriales bacterium]
MSLNRLYNIFKSEPLERSDVEAYGRSEDPSVKNSIEQKAMDDSFDQDAMDGWEELSYDTSVMSNLDSKFAPSKGISPYKLIGGTAIVATTIVAVIYFSDRPKESTPVVATTETKEEAPVTKMNVIVLDESDVSLPEPIEQMKQAPKEEQVEAKQISKEFQDIVTFRTETPPVPIQELPVVNPIPVPKPEIVRDHKEAKEIYLHSMKLVDYRKYREKPQVKTKQLLLTGTPADKEGEYSEDEDPVWREVDVPYIDFIDKSVKVFERGNYKKALSRFETILETYPDDVNANFYAGICLFNLREYPKAIEYFENCMDGKFSNFDEEALWMTAESYDKLKQKSKAQTIYQTIADGNGFYASQAKEKLK